MKEIKFRYSYSASIDLLYVLFGVFLFLLLFPVIHITEDLSIWILEKFSIIGLILIIIFALIFVIVFMTFPYYLSLKVNDKKGIAVFDDDCVKIKKGRKEIRINYTEIIDIKYFEIVVLIKGTRRSGYKLEIKTKDINLKLRSSLKELWENRIKEFKKDFSIMKLLKISELNNFHMNLEDIYDEIELRIALKHESYKTNASTQQTCYHGG